MPTNKLNLDELESSHFHLVGRLSAADRYADGLTQLFFGFPLTKFLLHTVIEPRNASNPEIRKAEQYLTMPTVSAIELANLILNSAKQSEDQLLKDLHESAREKVKNILSNYKLENPVEGFDTEEITPAKKPPAKKSSKIKK
jgi:hypothetical protein